MKDKYYFNDDDITTDILFKIEHIVNIISNKDDISFDNAYESFINSKTYTAIKRTANLYWAESAEFIADEYFREKLR